MNKIQEYIKLAITMGDPGGVGPEIIIKALRKLDEEFYSRCKPVVIGSMDVLEFYAQGAGVEVDLISITEKEISSVEVNAKKIAILDSEKIHLQDIEKLSGKVTAEGGYASFQYVATAIRLAMQSVVDGIVTAPISKSAWHLADIHFPGHTEMLAHYSDTREFAMMMVAEKLRVVLATIHIPLREVPLVLNQDKLLRLFRLVDNFMPYFGISWKAQIGVCGLNPHAGEEGLLGNEEQTIISPAIEQARKEGISVVGPFPADTIYNRMMEGELDVVVAMYHDQGLIPIKTLDFYGGVNVTIGLPFVRTSVDHGTAFDIAGKGIASEKSLLNALRLAVTLAENKRKLDYGREKN